VDSLKSISDFYVAGINYRKTDAAIRGHFAINNDQYKTLLQSAAAYPVNELFVLSTCNRTEVYGIAASSSALVSLLCSQTRGDRATFEASAYIKQGKAAIEHLFQVAAGLDSQILGDYEVISQIKNAIALAREYGFINLFLDKLMQHTLQSSRSIRSNTRLSSGTVSVSFAAVQYMKQRVPDIAGKKILLVGVGKIGRNTCKNITGHLGTTNITLVNRTDEKAAELAAELGLHYAPYASLDAEIAASQVILVATNSVEPTIYAHQVAGSGPKMIIDLSVPYNVDTAVADLPGIHLVQVDELSKINDETLQNRMAEVPKAKSIIAAQITEFREWYLMRKNVPVIRAVKDKLEYIQSCSMCGDTPAPDHEKIQKVLNNMATRMKQQNQGGCNYIEAINDFMTRS
jgi:glutamyl-tRNA reductase